MAARYPEEIQLLVRQTGAQIGITHDGDADRVLLCDDKGEVVDGDEIMAIMARVNILKPGQARRNNTLVATVMSNFGLEESRRRVRRRPGPSHAGRRPVRTSRRWSRAGLNVGGEQSGHMIFRDFTTTGDGIITALQILRIMLDTGKPLSELKRCLVKYPQAQRSLKVTRKPPLGELSDVSELLRETEQALAGKGRVLLRYSGTEPKVRLLVEGRDQTMIEAQADRIAASLTASIGA